MVKMKQWGEKKREERRRSATHQQSDARELFDCKK